MNHKRNKYRSEQAFSLTELLIVIMIIALLVAVLVPGLALAKERTRRAVCMSNLHQLLLGLYVYAENNNYRLPSNGFANTFLLLTPSFNHLAESSGSRESLFCPSIREPFMLKNSSGGAGSIYGNDGYWIGYNYLGGHPDTPWTPVPPAAAAWKSPLSTAGRTAVPVVTELNIWSPGIGQTVAPHGAKGPIRQGDDYMNTAAGGLSSEQLGARGGNIGLLDGSGFWKKIEQTTVYTVDNNPTGSWFSAW